MLYKVRSEVVTDLGITEDDLKIAEALAEPRRKSTNFKNYPRMLQCDIS